MRFLSASLHSCPRPLSSFLFSVPCLPHPVLDPAERETIVVIVFNDLTEAPRSIIGQREKVTSFVFVSLLVSFDQ